MTDRPTAIAAPASRRWGWLALPLLALVVAVFLGWRSWSAGGERIVVLASEGHGIEAGDPLRFRGITVGEVEAVALQDDLSGVALNVRLVPGAEALAREGSRFWIVRPQVGLDGVEGLETVVGTRYLSVVPGPDGADARGRFVALDEPPLQVPLEENGLRIVLEAPSRFGLRRGAPVAYRQVRVGTVTRVALASDASAVEVGVHVRPEYRALVRENTRFWESGGLEVDLRLTEGLSVELESLRSLLVGGVALATPPDAGPEAADGARFGLHADAEPEWLAWRPTLPVGSHVALDLEHPALLSAELTWRETGILRRSRKRSGWLLPVEGGVVGPADLLAVPEDVREPGATLRVGDAETVLEGPPIRAAEGVARRAFDHDSKATWDGRVARLGAPRDCLVVAGGARAVRGLARRHLSAVPGGWDVADDVRFDADWHGAAVLERNGGACIGVLLAGADGARIAPVSGAAD